MEIGSPQFELRKKFYIMIEIKNKKIKIFTDGANLDAISNLSKDPLIDGITTNPTLMKKSV